MILRELFTHRREGYGDDACRQVQLARRCRQILKGIATASRGRAALALLLMAGMLCAGSAALANVELQLLPRGKPSKYGAGSRGLYIGDQFTYINHKLTNFRFVDVVMDINSADGDAVVAGHMRRLGGPASEKNWFLDELLLTDVEFRNFDGTYKDGMMYNGPVTHDMISNMAAGLNPFDPLGVGSDWSSFVDWGFEWKMLDLNLFHPVGASLISTTGWDGFAMPSMGHQLVAELHFDPDFGLTFEAWYKNDDAIAAGDYYNVGDTKANALLLANTGGTTGETPVPEPSTMVLALIGALAILATRWRVRRR